MLDLRLLSHALTLAEHGSFARAARVLHLSQSALSRSIQSLESQLGVTLFERGKSGTEPTDAGQLILKKARELARQASELEAEAGTLPKRNGQGLRIASGPYPARISVPRAIARCLDTKPNFQVVARVDSWVGVVNEVIERKAEIGICEISELPAATFDVAALRPHQGHAVARSGHPLARQPALEIGAIMKYPVALTGRLPPRLLGKLLPGGGNSIPNIRCESIETVLEICAHSNAITFLTEPMLPAALATGALTKLDFAPPWLHTASGLIRLKSHPLSPEGQMFWDAVLAVDSDMG